MGRLSWIIQVDPKCHHMYPYKRGAEGNLYTEEKGVVWPQRQRLEWCSHKSRNSVNHQKLEELRTDSSLEPPERVSFCPHIDFSSVKLILFFQPPELRE